MSDDVNAKPIVVKRIKKVVGGAHGGAWKIAYADFVTAMMAFFLLMWLLGSTTSGDLKGISEYFKTPLRVALLGGSGAGDSTSLIKGGGEDITKRAGQIRAGDMPRENRSVDREIVQEEAMKFAQEHERRKLEALKREIAQAFDNNLSLKKFRNQILLDITAEGLRIQIVDEKNRPMFQSGSAFLEPYAVEILWEIGRVLNDVPNRISLSGHTDAMPYAGGTLGYSNWELSADRANAARRELIAAGLDSEKVVKVVGLASAVLFDKEDPMNPVNRRISIVVMNEQAAAKALHDESVLELEVQ